MKKKILSLLLAVCMVVSLLPVSAFAKIAPQQNENSKISPADKQAAIAENRPAKAGESIDGLTVTELDKDALSVKDTLASSAPADAAFTAYDDTDSVRVMVVMDGVSLLDSGFTQQELTSASAVYAAEAMVEMQDDLVSQIQSVVDDLSLTSRSRRSSDTTVTVQYHYTALLNGVSVQMPYGALKTVRSMAGVAAAFVVPTYSVPEDMTDSTAQPTMYATQTSFGSAQTWDAGYTGKGMRIAIIDTGLDLDHPSFADAPADPSLTAEELEGVLTQLNAYESYSKKSAVTLKTRNLYRSEKVAYGFNYVDVDLDITHDKDQQGYHGTHVAGITAANKLDSTDVVGVAPDAQLLIMKVFGKNGGAYWDDIVAALEDSILLNADAVNMSLGSPAGFDESDETTAEFNAWCNEIYAKVEQCDMILAVAAGNSYSAAYGTPLGEDLDYASNPDNSIISSPATYPSATAVASIENASVMYECISVNGEKIPYTDAAAYSFKDLTQYGQTEYPYVMIDGYGTAEDFAAAGESWENYGKIAVVSRGNLAFTDKQTNAANAGFTALIVYNNADDGLMNMQDAESIPNIFVTKEGGAVLAAAADENGEGVLTIEDNMMVTESPTAGQMSDFSSWGVSPDLELTPDVTAPGGNIYSTADKGQYAVMSGTSMATPHIAGMSALVLEYLHKEYPDMEDTWYRTAAEALIMSTAEPVTEPTGQLYSPRKQGAGAANVYSAVSSAAYLTVDGTTPKISLGDDDAKTGKYTFTFEINNLTDAELTYRLDGTALTDQVKVIDGVKYMGETARLLDGTFDFSVLSVSDPVYDYNEDGVFDLDDVQDLLDDVNYERTVKDGFELTGDGVVDTADAQALYELLMAKVVKHAETAVVPANGRITVSATLTLSAEDKAYMDANYANGIYVDAFVRCYGAEEIGDLSLPVVGFYGDWSAAPVFDDEAWDLMNEAPSRYWNVLWTDTNYSWALGSNPYVTEEREEAHFVLSPNGDGYQDAIYDIYLGLLRNAQKLVFTWKDAQGNVLQRTESEFARKSYYNSSYELCVPYIFSNYVQEEVYDFAGAQDLDKYTFCIEAYLDDGDEVVDDAVEIPIVIDNTAPVLDMDSVQYNTEDGKRILTFTVSDNYDIAAVLTLTSAGSIIDTIPVNSKTAGTDGETFTLSLDVSDYDTDFVVAVCDYGFNEALYGFSFAGEGGQNVNPNAFYGYRQTSVIPSGGYNYVVTAYNGWYSFTDASSMLMHTDAYYTGEADVQAAEYVDGWVIGIDVDGNIFAMQAGSWDRRNFGTMGSYPTVLDMAYDFSSNTMYVLTDEEYAGEGGYLLTLDILTGELTELGQPSGFPDKMVDYGYWSYVDTYGQALTLACDNAGVLYTVNHADGDLYTIDPATCEGTLVGSTGYEPKYYQSMTVDHTTDKLYWAAYQGYSGISHFYEVDKETGAATDVTSSGVQHNAQMTALYKPYTQCGDLIPDDAALTGILLNASQLKLVTGTAAALTVTPVPYYAQLGELTWVSDDPSIVTVEDGIVTAVGEGTTTVRVTCGDFTQECTVTAIRVDADLVSYDGANNQWLTFAANAPQNAVDANGMEAANLSYNYFISAAYAHGYVYAFDYYGGFYKMDAETLQGVRLGGNNKVNGTSGLMIAMAYNYADGYLYGLAQLSEGSGWDTVTSYNLVRINPANGRFDLVGTFDQENTVYNMTVDRNGNFYSVVDAMDYDTWETATQVMTYTAEDGYLSINGTVALSDFTPSDYLTVSSLAWSEENGCLIWADYYGLLQRIDPVTGENLVLGYLGNTVNNESIYNTCLMVMLDPATEPEAPEYVAIEDMSMADVRLLVGSSVAATISVEPWNAAASFRYTVEDESIATVNSNGEVTGVSAGETVLTVEEENSGRTLTAKVTVLPSTGDVYGMVVQDLSYGQNYWAAISDTDPAEIEVAQDFSGTFFAPYAGAYYDGYLYAYSHAVDDIVDADGFDYEYRYYLLRIDPVDYTYEVLGNNRRIHESIMDMAFDYETGAMYGIANQVMGDSALVQIDLETAEVTTVGYTEGLDIRTVTFDDTHQLYGISVDGDLYRIDKYTAETELVGATGASTLDAYQSMTYDYETGNTYWAQYSNDGTNGLLLVDLETGASSNLGCIYGVGASVACLYTVSANDPVVADTVDITGVVLPEKSTVVVDETVTLNATVLPVSVADVEDEIRWSSSNEQVATVDADGVVTGISAGTATITASIGGYSAQCLVTVTAEARRFYAYDESSRAWISFSAEDTTDTAVEREDNEDEDKIVASLYRDGKLYSFTADGKFWSVDPDTFERTLISEGFNGVKIGVTETDWWGGESTSYHDVMPLSMAYDEGTDKAYVQLMPYDLFDYGYDFYSFYGIALVELDLETGAFVGVDITEETIWETDYDTWEEYEVEVKVLSGDYCWCEEGQTNAVLIHDGVAVFVDTFTSGMVSYLNLATGEYVQSALINGYWGNAEHGRSLVEDPLTGTVYIIRDMRDWGGPITLNTINLSDGDVVELGLIGLEGSIVNSLFLK